MDEGFKKALASVSKTVFLCGVMLLAIWAFSFVDSLYLNAAIALLLVVNAFIWAVLGSWVVFHKEYEGDVFWQNQKKDKAVSWLLCLSVFYAVCIATPLKEASLTGLVIIFLLLCFSYRDIRDAR